MDLSELDQNKSVSTTLGSQALVKLFCYGDGNYLERLSGCVL